jgi:hypothetical protein
VVGAPENASLPTISGTAQVGQTLTAGAGGWTGTQPISYAYQWRRCDGAGTNCGDIGGATGTTYPLVAEDEGKTLRVGVTASNIAGSASADSAPSSVVEPASGGGSTYYVSTSGKDSNPGTEAQPWRTPQKAIDAMQPGDQTYVKAGTYGRTVCDSSGGDGGSAGGGHVTLRAYGSDRPVLTASTDGVLAIGCDYLRVVGLVIKGPGVVGGTLVYGMSNSDHVQLIGNEVQGSVCQGIYTEEETADYEILRNWIHNNGTSACDRQAHGIYLQGDRHLVANNLIHDHPEGFGIQNYDYSRNVKIVGNTISHAGHGGIVVGGSGCGPGGCKVAGTVVVGNILAYNGTYGIDRDSTAPTSCSIHHNLAFQNGSASYDSGWPSGCLGANSTANPLFVNVGARNLRLQTGSPAIDAGDAAYMYSPAFDGVARPQGAGPDIGAYEL